MVQSLKKAGLGSLELFCMGLKATGCYLARTLSYKGADFEMEKIHLDPGFRRERAQLGAQGFRVWLWCARAMACSHAGVPAVGSRLHQATRASKANGTGTGRCRPTRQPFALTQFALFFLRAATG